MTEIFENISDELRKTAELFWNLALSKETLADTVDTLNYITNIYRDHGTPEEVEFLQFYFRMKMEMIKND